MCILKKCNYNVMTKRKCNYKSVKSVITKQKCNYKKRLKTVENTYFLAKPFCTQKSI